MNSTQQIIDAFGGVKPVMHLFGLTKARVYQFQSWDFIPRHWLMVMILLRPELDWKKLGHGDLFEEVQQSIAGLQANLESGLAKRGPVRRKRSK